MTVSDVVKQQQRSEIEALTASFLANGGKIKVGEPAKYVPTTVYSSEFKEIKVPVLANNPLKGGPLHRKKSS